MRKMQRAFIGLGAALLGAVGAPDAAWSAVPDCCGGTGCDRLGPLG